MVGEILSFAYDSFYFFLFNSLVVEAVRKLKTEGKKDKDTFILKLYFGVYDYSVGKCFPETSENSRVSTRQGVEI